MIILRFAHIANLTVNAFILNVIFYLILLPFINRVIVALTAFIHLVDGSAYFLPPKSKLVHSLLIVMLHCVISFLAFL